MMKKNFSLVIFIFFLGLTAGVAPMGAWGQSNQNGAGERAGYFCQNVNSWADKIQNRFAEREGLVMGRQDERAVNIEERRMERTANLEQKRDGWDENREEHYANLEAKAASDEQKQAVDEFKSTVESAVTIRRQKVDDAITSYRTGVDGLISDKKQKLDQAVADYKAAILAAGEQAKADCGSGLAVATVRQNYHAALKTARDNFQASRREIDKIADEVSELNQTRRETIARAMEEFRTALQAAKNKLKQSWGLTAS